MKSTAVFLFVVFVAYTVSMPLINPEIEAESEDWLEDIFKGGNAVFTLRDPKEMVERLKDIPFVTTTAKSDNESYVTIGPIKSDAETYPETLTHPEEITKRIVGIPFVTTTNSE